MLPFNDRDDRVIDEQAMRLIRRRAIDNLFDYRGHVERFFSTSERGAKTTAKSNPISHAHDI